MMDWAAAAQARMADGATALVTVLATEGSAPRGAGTRMIVTAEGAWGTIGGGQLEYRIVEQARAMLGQPAGTWRMQDYPLGPLLGQCCGGRVRMLVEHLGHDDEAGDWLDGAVPGAVVRHRFGETRVVRTVGTGDPGPVSARGERPVEIVERLAPPGRPLLLFGAGHVGQAIAAKLAGLPFVLGWFDTRPEMAARDGVMLVAEEAIADCAADAAAGAVVLILTHDHALDYRLTVAALASRAGYVGLIGSATKRARFLARLDRDGIGIADRARLTCPIGLAGIDGNAPDVIAIAVLAQLLGEAA